MFGVLGPLIKPGEWLSCKDYIIGCRMNGTGGPTSELTAALRPNHIPVGEISTAPGDPILGEMLRY